MQQKTFLSSAAFYVDMYFSVIIFLTVFHKILLCCILPISGT